MRHSAGVKDVQGKGGGRGGGRHESDREREGSEDDAEDAKNQISLIVRVFSSLHIMLTN